MKKKLRYTIEYYSVIKRNELSNHEKTQRNFSCILLSERSQSEKATYNMVPLIGPSGKSKTIKTVKRSVVTRSQGRGEG